MTWGLFLPPVLLLSLGLCIYGFYGLAAYRKQCIPWLKRACYWFALSPIAFVITGFFVAIIGGE